MVRSTQVSGLTIRSTKVFVPLVVLLSAITADAQVNKCVGPSGKITYTDGACGSGERSKVVAEKQTAEQARAESLAAAEGRERFYREQVSAANAAAAGIRPAIAAPAGATSLGGPTECDRARRDLEVAQKSITRKTKPLAEIAAVESACGVDLTPQERPRVVVVRPRVPPPPAPPVLVTSCSPSGCAGSDGNFYSDRNGRYYSSTGKVCYIAGRTLQCN